MELEEHACKVNQCRAHNQETHSCPDFVHHICFIKLVSVSYQKGCQCWAIGLWPRIQTRGQEVVACRMLGISEPTAQGQASPADAKGPGECISPGQAMAETADVCERAADHKGQKTRKSGDAWHAYKGPQELWLLPRVLHYASNSSLVANIFTNMNGNSTLGKTSTA